MRVWTDAIDEAHNKIMKRKFKQWLIAIQPLKQIYLLKLTESHGVYTRVCIYYKHVVVFTYK